MSKRAVTVEVITLTKRYLHNYDISQINYTNDLGLKDNIDQLLYVVCTST